MAKSLLYAAALLLLAFSATTIEGVRLTPQPIDFRLAGGGSLLEIPPATRKNLADKIASYTSFPMYEQCDPRWGADEMGIVGYGERNSLCNEGGAISSVSMALAGLGAHINGALVNPGTLNTWLKSHGGYLCIKGDCNNLDLTATERLTTVMSLIGEYQAEDVEADFEEISQGIERRRIIYVAHVRNNTHFVLLTKPVAGERAFHVHDSAYNVSVYPYSNITDLIRFKVNVYPLYKQCNASWGDLPMGGGPNNYTICDVGCLMSSTSMGIAGTGIQIEGQNSNPQVLNKFMQTHHGYVTNTSDMLEGAIMQVEPSRIIWNATGFHLSNNIPFSKVQSFIDAEVPVVLIANVMHGQHFVLVVGYRHDGDTLVVNDPGFNRNTYSYTNDVVGWRYFFMH